MDVLIIGSRGREHALALQLKNDIRVDNIFCIPGNGGIGEIATCLKLDIFNFENILKFLETHPQIGLTIVSPDELLANGLIDFLNKKGHRAFGCSANAARMEGNKEFANNLCSKYGIPAPKYQIFDDYNKAKKYIKTQKFPLVVKTNGRTGGKGIMFCKNQRDAENALYDLMVAKLFGNSGDKIAIEEFVTGKICVVMVFTDGQTVLPLPAVENYKRVYDGNLGMSTAGMGASFPADGYTDEVAEETYNKIIIPTVNALRNENSEFKGVLGFSIVISEDGVKVVDFVSRFCDVESQILIPQIETPILDIFNAIIDGKLNEIDIKMRNESGVCVVATSGGYPLEYNKNFKIVIGDLESDVKIYHSGTKIVDGELKTSAGRVLGVAGFGNTKEECAKIVYRNITKINFDGMHYRKDIAQKE